MPESHLSSVLDRTIRARLREYRVTVAQQATNPSFPNTARYYHERATLALLFEIRARGKGRRE
jgi:hypothetical protein